MGRISGRSPGIDLVSLREQIGMLSSLLQSSLPQGGRFPQPAAGGRKQSLGFNVDVLGMRDQLRAGGASAPVARSGKQTPGFNVDLRGELGMLRALVLRLAEKQGVDTAELLAGSTMRTAIENAAGGMRSLTDEEKMERLQRVFQDELAAWAAGRKLPKG